MNAEQIHIKQLTDLGYKKNVIKKLVGVFNSQQKYLFAEKVHEIEHNKTIADIRKKLTPINNLIAMIEDTNAILLMDTEKAKFIKTEMEKAKYSIEYLSNL